MFYITKMWGKFSWIFPLGKCLWKVQLFNKRVFPKSRSNQIFDQIFYFYKNFFTFTKTFTLLVKMSELKALFVNKKRDKYNWFIGSITEGVGTA